MKRIALITTGGTIAMTKDPRTGGAIPALSANRSITEIDRLKEIAMIEHHEFSNLPSPHMTPETMWKLSMLVNSLLKRDDISGAVITHGTDTLEETAYFLDLTVGSEKPVVCTAAMRSIDELGTDGPRNVVSSVRVAVNPISVGMGTMVCLNDEIHAAREVTKTYTSNVATFDSPGYGPLGIVDEDKVIFYRKPLLRESFEVEKIEENIALFKTFTGDDGRILRTLPEMGFKGIVLEAFGRGNVPPKVADSIEELITKQHIPVIITSRCFKGRVLGVYGYKGGGLSLEMAGAIFAQGLSSQKARIKLMIVMGITNKLSQIKEFFVHSRGGRGWIRA
ncbi:asparaginase [Kosmotoga pacifica]|uniref:Asparaginase n=1 Tax=Kosmotoga pacifica TaxID=1330330 RepID=A0A0G2ZES0_9BACT|nr:asparaginase [Kosmotoga pacifica]AKI98044.1 asparaginase [Kosmotoga pacifica]